jgi:hypothetical protein
MSDEIACTLACSWNGGTYTTIRPEWIVNHEELTCDSYISWSISQISIYGIPHCIKILETQPADNSFLCASMKRTKSVAMCPVEPVSADTINFVGLHTQWECAR